MILHGKVYDVLKQIALIWLPAFGVLYTTVAMVWHLSHTDSVATTILAVDTFLGAVLGISSNSYNNSGAKYDGVLSVEPNADGGQNLLFRHVDAKALNTKDELLFKLDDSSLHSSPAPVVVEAPGSPE